MIICSFEDWGYRSNSVEDVDEETFYDAVTKELIVTSVQETQKWCGELSSAVLSWGNVPCPRGQRGGNTDCYSLFYICKYHRLCIEWTVRFETLRDFKWIWVDKNKYSFSFKSLISSWPSLPMYCTAKNWNLIKSYCLIFNKKYILD